MSSIPVKSPSGIHKDLQMIEESAERAELAFAGMMLLALKFRTDLEPKMVFVLKCIEFATFVDLWNRLLEH
ncbi:MAG: hypothetical protein OXH90_09980 [Paracoccaceae bacterium]|nr:hypothetical protein [Paracoccaceae bacterium]MDE2917662.1 hypothetical protein [Paracoccaceae bacterium]